MAQLEIRGLSRSYGGIIPALVDVDLSIDSGEMVALLGPSGSGKSTLLSLIAGFEYPDRGSVAVDGRVVNARDAVDYRRNVIGVLFQHYHLLETLTACQNIELAMFPTHAEPMQRYRRARDLLQQVGLAARADQIANRLSGGERQRVAFCRSIVNQPRLLLADEPTGSLDTASKLELLQLLRRWMDAERRTLVVATHDADVASACSRVVRLRDGRLEAA